MTNDECRMLKGGLTFAALLVAAALARADAPQATFLAVVDKQGLLTPIAVYDGSTWWNRWPWGAESDEIRKLPIPRSLSAIPGDWLPPGLKLPDRWRAFPQSGRPVSVRTLRPGRRLGWAIMDTVVVRTTYRGRSDDEDVVAVSGRGTLGWFVVPAAGERDAILRQLEPRIAAREADAIAHWREARSATGEKDDVPPTRIYLVSDGSVNRYIDTPTPREPDDYGLLKAPTPVNGRTYYRLAGEKYFRVREGNDCKMLLTTEGIVGVTAAGTVVVENVSAGAFSEFCGDASETMFPLATITIGSRTWWIERTDLEDGYDYGLLDPLTGDEVEIKGLWGLRSNSQPLRHSPLTGIRHSAFVIRH